MKKVLIIGLALIGLVGAGWVWRTRVLATEAATSTQPVVDKLVERFDLNKGEVETVFDEAREERQQQMQKQRQARMEERLDEAVSDGAITADQKQALLDKQAEMQERFQQLREEWQQWQEQSGIDFEALVPYHFGGGGRGFGPGKTHGFGGW